MAEYLQLQTFATYNEKNVASLLQRYRNVLIQLGCQDTQVIDWLSQSEWPASDEEGFGDIYASPFTLQPEQKESIECAGLDIVFYGEMPMLGLKEPSSWIRFNLLFEDQALRSAPAGIYRDEVGAALWRIALALASTFREVGVYFTDEWQENRSWRAIIETVGDPWMFDLAIFPRSLAERFEEVPPGFQGTVIDGGFGFAQENRWHTLPWVKAAL
jgi:hypothetical protein